MSDSVRPHGQQPTRLPRLWNSPGKNTGVGCHFLLQCMKLKSESEVVQSCPTLSDLMDCQSHFNDLVAICLDATILNSAGLENKKGSAYREKDSKKQTNLASEPIKY